MSIQERFINQVLTREGERLVKNQGIAIASSVSDKATGHLLNNRFVEVSGSHLRFEHPIYERFLDLKVLNRNGKKIKRKPLKIHNRFVYGHAYAIRDELAVGLTDEIRENIKKEFEISQTDKL